LDCKQEDFFNKDTEKQFENNFDYSILNPTDSDSAMDEQNKESESENDIEMRPYSKKTVTNLKKKKKSKNQNKKISSVEENPTCPEAVIDEENIEIDTQNDIEMKTDRSKTNSYSIKKRGKKSKHRNKKISFVAKNTTNFDSVMQTETGIL
jgi:hypothetical protein